MPGFANHEWIARAPEEVYRFFLDENRLGSALKNVVRMEKITPGETRVGTQFKRTTATSKKEEVNILEITELVENGVYAIQMQKGPFRAVYRYELHPQDGGTRIDFTADISASAAGKLLLPMVAKAIKE